MNAFLRSLKLKGHDVLTTNDNYHKHIVIDNYIYCDNIYLKNIKELHFYPHDNCKNLCIDCFFAFFNYFKNEFNLVEENKKKLLTKKCSFTKEGIQCDTLVKYLYENHCDKHKDVYINQYLVMFPKDIAKMIYQFGI